MCDGINAVAGSGITKAAAGRGSCTPVDADSGSCNRAVAAVIAAVSRLAGTLPRNFCFALSLFCLKIRF